MPETALDAGPPARLAGGIRRCAQRLRPSPRPGWARRLASRISPEPGGYPARHLVQKGERQSGRRDPRAGEDPDTQQAGPCRP